MTRRFLLIAFTLGFLGFAFLGLTSGWSGMFNLTPLTTAQTVIR